MTEVFPGKSAEKAGIKVGDVILAVGGKDVETTHPGDTEALDRVVHRLSVGDKTTLKIYRQSKPLEVQMVLEAQPTPDDDVKKLTDDDFDFTAREPSYTDRVSKHIPETLQGVLVQKVERGGWAALGGLRGDDFIISVDGQPTPTVAELKSLLKKVLKNKPRQVVFFVRRGIHTVFCEIEPEYH